MDLIKYLSTLTTYEPQLRLLIDLIPEFIVLKDGKGRWLVTNKLVLNSYGFKEDFPYHGKTDLELAEILPSQRHNFMYNMETDEMAWGNGKEIQIEKSFQTPDGIARTWEVIKTPIFDKNGNRSHLVIVSREITKRKNAEDALKISETNFRFIAENMRDILITIDCKGMITYLSPSFEKVTGYSIIEYINREAFELMNYIHPNKYNAFRQVYRELLTNRTNFNKNFEFQFLKKDGQYIWLEANVNTTYNENGGFDKLVLVARDIIERKHYQTQLETYAYYDHLTNIPNRRFFMDKLSEEISRAKNSVHFLALMYLDIDHFKRINDTMGHEIGDQLLVMLTRRIQNILRNTDVLARLGGDEFAIILPDLSSTDEAKIIGERIVNKLKEPWHIKGHTFQTTSSIGIAFYLNDGTSPQSLVCNADKALYKAKVNGRAHVSFYSN
ncbi:sensor domain-containing protein [Metabacillus sp. B2-18]|uniref:sensor domain-containing protein n=1 Tax=Metabacillus sp. B2-18 TaxID=2897333 RepID=UPI001E608345|nr:diguanylate cyclase [Metabacillus sp. B2-18]UGB33207.1 diguanylate cyclase [Metabacillus sp. B2-18]